MKTEIEKFENHNKEMLEALKEEFNKKLAFLGNDLNIETYMVMTGSIDGLEITSSQESFTFTVLSIIMNLCKEKGFKGSIKNNKINIFI